MFTEQPQGQTHFCEACENKARGIFGGEHTCGRLRCSKCNNPFEPHHWRHTKDGKHYHTGCFEKYKFPSLLEKKDQEWRKKIKEVCEEIKKTCYTNIPNGTIEGMKTDSFNKALDQVKQKLLD